MPRFLEKRLKAEYGEKSDMPYKVMNALGYMHGSKETAKGAAAENKHESKGVPGEKDKEKETGAGLMGKQHPSKPVTEPDKHMSVRHKNNRAELDDMEDTDGDETLQQSNMYNLQHAEEHIEQMKHNNRLLDDKKKNKAVDKLLKKIHKG